MLYSNEKQTMRQMFYEAWDKAKKKQILTPLESQLVQVIELHPEYHEMFNGQSSPASEAFLHLSLHLAIRDQLSLNRPLGIQSIYKQLQKQGWPELEIEHKMMACLSEVMWAAQKNQQPVDEQQYSALLLALTKE